MNNDKIETASHSLADAFRRGIIRGLEDYGDNREVPHPDEILASARSVLEQEDRDFNIRSRALAHREEITFGTRRVPASFKFPGPDKIPLVFNEYSYLGGTYFLDDVSMTLEEGLRECLQHTIDDWLMELPGVSNVLNRPIKSPPIEIIHEH